MTERTVWFVILEGNNNTTIPQCNKCDDKRNMGDY